MERNDSRPWYFLHIPKTAGTTFRVLLENRFHMDDICPVYEFFQIGQYSDEQLRSFRLFRGHMGYNLVNYLPEKPRVMVMLRDPMERAVSHFEYIRRDPGHPKHRIIHERNMGLKEYLLDPVLSAEVTNAQVRPLAHLADRQVLLQLVKGSHSQDEFARAWRHRDGVLPPEDELLDVALQRLETTDFVGIAEDLERGMELASWLLDASPPQQLQPLNINPVRTRLENLPEDTLVLLKQATLLDRKLYEKGRALFETGYEKMRKEQTVGQISHSCAMASMETSGGLVVDFLQPLCGDGWHQRELVPGKGILRWTGPGTMSHLYITLPQGKAYCMDMVLADWLDDKLLNVMVIRVDDQQLPSEVVELNGETCVRVLLPASNLKRRRIDLVLPRTATRQDVNGDAIDHSRFRRQGIAVYCFRFTDL